MAFVKKFKSYFNFKSLRASPLPFPLKMFWKSGSILGAIFTIQLASGIILAAFYSSLFTFSHKEHVWRDCLYGDSFRMAHAMGASMIFFFLFFHLGRKMYFRTYLNRGVWLSGCHLFILMQLVAFLGYVLPYGKMSHWAATVIVNLCSVIPFFGNTILQLVFGGESMSEEALPRFFIVHMLVPFGMFILIGVHVWKLHKHFSTTPLGLHGPSSNLIAFFPQYLYMDMVGVFFALFLIMLCGYSLSKMFFYFNPDNFVEADLGKTPPHIIPEWYFLPHYAILRSVESKIGGVLLLVLFVASIYVFSFTNRMSVLSSEVHISGVMVFFKTIMLLGFLGAQTMEETYFTFVVTGVALYFFYCLFWVNSRYFNL